MLDVVTTDVQKRETDAARADGGLFHIRDVLPDVLVRYLDRPREQQSLVPGFAVGEAMIESEALAF